MVAVSLKKVGTYVPEIRVTIDDKTQIVTVSVTADADQVAPLGILSFALGDSVSFSVSQALEPI